MDSGEVGAVQFFDNGACGEHGDEHDNENRCDVTNVFHGNMISDYAAKVRKKTLIQPPHVWRFLDWGVLINKDCSAVTPWQPHGATPSSLRQGNKCRR